MHSIFEYGLINAALASLLAFGVMLALHKRRNPYVARMLWLVVLLKFVAPALMTIPVPSLVGTVTLRSATHELSAGWSRKQEQVRPSPSQEKDRASMILTASQELAAAAPMTAGSSRPLEETAASSRFLLVSGVLQFVWLAGAVSIACIVLHRIGRLHILIQRMKPACEALRRQAADIAQELGLSSTLDVRLADGTITPLVWPLGKRPTLVLPGALMARLSEEETTAVLAHEVMHIKRKDSWVRWVEIVVTSLFWWCPFSWVARCRLQEAEERCCDADVLGRFPRLRECYANALFETMEFLTESDPCTLAGARFAGSRVLTRRFEMIVSPTTPRPPARLTRLLLLLAAVALVGALPRVSTSADIALTQDHPQPSGEQHVVVASDKQLRPAEQETSSDNGIGNEELENVPLSALRQSPPAAYLLNPGDTLGVYIEGVLGDAKTPPPVNIPDDVDLPPSLGYPIPVREDGAISLPMVGSIKVQGFTIEKAERKVITEYRDRQIIREADRRRVLVTLMRPRYIRVLVLRHDHQRRSSPTQTESLVGLGPAPTSTGGDLEVFRTVVKLPAFQNDVLTALVRTGGLPGPDAAREVIIERGVWDGLSDPKRRVIRIPLQVKHGKPLPFEKDDVILKTGDVLTVVAGGRHDALSRP